MARPAASAYQTVNMIRAQQSTPRLIFGTFSSRLRGDIAFFVISEAFHAEVDVAAVNHDAGRSRIVAVLAHAIDGLLSQYVEILL